jgi:hypothetical protein
MFLAIIDKPQITLSNDRIMKYFLITAISACLISCQKTNGGSQNLVPASTASNWQQKEISTTLAEIQNFADELGLGKNFKSFPIVIVDSFPGPNEVLAYCQQDEDGAGVYIGILKSTMYDYIDRSDNNYNSFLYMLLVHEFGHCFYQRQHDESTIAFPGMHVFFRTRFFPPEYISIGSEIPVSVMTHTPRPETSHFLPDGVKKYYLAEVAGLTRWQTLMDVEKTPGVHIGFE